MLRESQRHNVNAVVLVKDRGDGEDLQRVINLTLALRGHHKIVRVLNEIRKAHLQIPFCLLGWHPKTVEPLQKGIPLAVHEVRPVIWKGIIDSKHSVRVRATRRLESRVDGDAVVFSAVRETLLVLLARIVRPH